jgi:ferric-dicitrate binding protein FerR (iron transport regulator)
MALNGGGSCYGEEQETVDAGRLRRGRGWRAMAGIAAWALWWLGATRPAEAHASSSTGKARQQREIEDERQIEIIHLTSGAQTSYKKRERDMSAMGGVGQVECYVRVFFIYLFISIFSFFLFLTKK